MATIQINKDPTPDRLTLLTADGRYQINLLGNKFENFQVCNGAEADPAVMVGALVLELGDMRAQLQECLQGSQLPDASDALVEASEQISQLTEHNRLYAEAHARDQELIDLLRNKIELLELKLK